MADLDATQTGTPAAPQQFDPIAEARRKWPGLQTETDDNILTKLSNPQGFRSAFPEYSHLSDEDISAHMGAFAQQRGQSTLRQTLANEIPNIEKSKTLAPPPLPDDPLTKGYKAISSTIQGAVVDPLAAMKQQGDAVAENVADTLLKPGLGGRVKQFLKETPPEEFGDHTRLAFDLAQRAGMVPKTSDVPEMIKNAFVAPEEPGQTSLERGARSGGRTISTILGLKGLGSEMLGEFKGAPEPELPYQQKRVQQLSTAIGRDNKAIKNLPEHVATVTPDLDATIMQHGAAPPTEIRNFIDMINQTIARLDGQVKGAAGRYRLVPINESAMDNPIAHALEQKAASLPLGEAKTARALLNQADEYRKPMTVGDLWNIKDHDNAINGRTYANPMTATAERAEALGKLTAGKAARQLLYDTLEKLRQNSAPGIDEGLQDVARRQGKLMDVRDALEAKKDRIESQYAEQAQLPWTSRARVHEYVSTGGHVGGAISGISRLLKTDAARELSVTNNSIKNAFKGLSSGIAPSTAAPPSVIRGLLRAPATPLGPAPDTSGTVPFSPPPFDFGSAASRTGRMLPESTQIELPPSDIATRGGVYPAASQVTRGTSGRMTRQFTTDVAQPTELFEGSRVAGQRPEVTNFRQPQQQAPPLPNVEPTARVRPFGELGEAIKIPIFDPVTGRRGVVPLNDLEEAVKTRGVRTYSGETPEQLKMKFFGGSRIGPKKVR